MPKSYRTISGSKSVVRTK